jgi:hypothetical protein
VESAFKTLKIKSNFDQPSENNRKYRRANRLEPLQGEERRNWEKLRNQKKSIRSIKSSLKSKRSKDSKKDRKSKRNNQIKPLKLDESGEFAKQMKNEKLKRK